MREIVGPDGDVVQPFSPKVLHEMDVDPSVLRVMRQAARETVALRHTYNLVDLPVRVAGKSGTAEFGTRDCQGPPAVLLVVRRVHAEGSVPWLHRRRGLELVVMAFAHDSRTVGNAATEIVKYFFQLHYDLDEDLRLPALLERGNFYTND